MTKKTTPFEMPTATVPAPPEVLAHLPPEDVIIDERAMEGLPFKADEAAPYAPPARFFPTEEYYAKLNVEFARKCGEMGDWTGRTTTYQHAWRSAVNQAIMDAYREATKNG